MSVVYLFLFNCIHRDSTIHSFQSRYVIYIWKTNWDRACTCENAIRIPTFYEQAEWARVGLARSARIEVFPLKT